MKKILVFIMTAVLLLSITACKKNMPLDDNLSSIPSQSDEQSSSEESEHEGNISEISENDVSALIVYFSWGGNTAKVADEIQSQTGADLLELVPEIPYTDDYNSLLDLAQQDQKDNARPAYIGNIDNLDDYDVIYLGYPIWWGDMPMILYSFLDDYDLSGKIIRPFCTSGGSGFSGTLSAIRDLEPEASVPEGLHIGSSAAASPTAAVTEWLTEFGLTE